MCFVKFYLLQYSKNCSLIFKIKSTELKTLEWDILNPDRIINLEIKNERRTIFNLEIKKKSGLSINPDIHHSKVFSSAKIF